MISAWYSSSGSYGHLPAPLPAEAVVTLATEVTGSGLTVRTINADIGAMNDPDLDGTELQQRLHTLIRLARALNAPAIILPCGNQGIRPRTELRADVASLAAALTTAAAITGEAGVAP
jgi:sugar phosphate isomerase/epimerase